MGLTRRLTALFAAFEAVLVVAIGIAIPLAPLTILWGAQYGFAADWTIFWRASVDFWLLGHGVDITVVLDPATAAALSLPGASTPVTLTIAALGFALLTVLLGARAGIRIAETGYLRLGSAVSLAVFAAVSCAVTLSTRHPSASPSLWQGTVLPTVVFAIGLAIGALRADGIRDAPAGRFAQWLDARPPRPRLIVSASLRGGVASAAGIVAAASVLTAVNIAASYARIITLYEGLHTEVLGGIAVTLAQPENLGPVTVRAHVSGDAVRIELVAPTEQARDALKAIMPDLRRDLSQSGGQLSLDLSSGNQPSGREWLRDSADGNRARDSRIPAVATSLGAPIAVRSESALDVLV